MNLYLISQTENHGYDTFDSCVVAAESEAEARLINPNYNGVWDEPFGSAWCKSPDAVTVEYLGEAKEGIEAGIILGSFNAG